MASVMHLKHTILEGLAVCITYKSEVLFYWQKLKLRAFSLAFLVETCALRLCFEETLFTDILNRQVLSDWGTEFNVQ